jgi:uncharacterized membrane protein YdjX (TVP38/TMEM64 family)
MRKSIVIKVLIILCLLSIAFAFFERFSMEDFTSFIEVLLKHKNKASTYITFFITSILASIVFIPVSWIKITGGLFLDFWPGLLLSWLAVNIGGSVIFLICRLLGKNILTDLLKNIAKNDGSRTSTLLSDIDKKGLPVVMNLQMLPIIPCSLVNILCGVSNVSYRNYIVGSLLGTLPGAIIFVNFSSKITSTSNSPYNIILSILLFIVFNLITYWYSKKDKFKFFNRTNN